MQPPKGLHVDHANHNGLDNRRSNLRICTQAENQRNRKLHCNNTSGFIGVCWGKSHRKWKAYIYSYKQHFHLGHFDTAEEAAGVRDVAAKNLHGEFAMLNGHKS
jgi:hypothetical protein